jgi:hypothetical protein
MQAVIKSIHSPDIENLETFKPDNHDNFAFLLQLFIGPAELDGEESFDVEVCTPQYIDMQKMKLFWGCIESSYLNTTMNVLFSVCGSTLPPAKVRRGMKLREKWL